MSVTAGTRYGGSGALALILAALTGTSAYAVPIPFNIELNTNGKMYGNPPVNQANVPASDGGGGDNSCVPTSVANSLAYLTNAFPKILGNSLLNDKATAGGPANPQPNTTAGWTTIATQLASKNYMKTSSTEGTTDQDWVDGTENYIKNNAPGVMTTFEAMDDPSANFILEQLQDREDLEIGITPTKEGAGVPHALTVSSAKGAAQSGTVISMSIDGIDPANPGTEFNLDLGGFTGPDLTLTYNGDAYFIDFAFAQSVPEPASLAILGVGIAGVWLPKWRRLRPATPPASPASPARSAPRRSAPHSAPRPCADCPTRTRTTARAPPSGPCGCG